MEIKNSIKCDSSTSNQNCNGSNQGRIYSLCTQKFPKNKHLSPTVFGKFCGRTKLMITIFKKSSKCLLLTGAKNTKTFKNKIFASFWNFSYIYDSDISIPFETNWFHQTRKFMNSWWLIKTKLIQKFRDAVIVSMS